MAQRPMGIMASFSEVSFRQDGVTVFSATVSSGGCFGPDDDLKVVNRGFEEKKREGNTAAFNEVSIKAQFGGSQRDYLAREKNGRIDPKSLRRVQP